MERIASLKYRFMQMLGPIMGFCLVLYFGYHLVSGDRGWFALQRVQTKLEKADAQLAELTAKRENLERDVVMLRSGSLDPDLLDERIRAVLGFSRPDDLIIITD